jgi:sarcosine oxidase subunit beta
MQNYSALSLLRHGLTGHRGWRPAWRKARLKPAYDAVIVGGGGHGLATAYYLAKVHGLRRVALLEKGWIGGGNTGRNTTAVRSNYFYPESVALYDLALRLYEGLSQELNYNVMLSQRGMLIAAHTPAQMEICTRIANAMQLNGVDGSLMGAAEAVRRMPLLNQTADARFRCLGGVWQGRAGVARHDAVAWGYARAASGLGVDIVENCEVTGIETTNGAVTGLETSLGPDPDGARGDRGGRRDARPRRHGGRAACRSMPTRCRPSCRSR